MAKAMTMPENNALSGWMRKNNRAAHVPRTLIQMTTWNFQIQGFNDNVNTQQQIFHSLYLLQWCFCKFHFPRALSKIRVVRNNNKIVTISQMFIFKWRFHCRCRHCCLNFLVLPIFSFLFFYTVLLDNYLCSYPCMITSRIP